MANTIHNRVREHRTRFGWSQEELARRAGISRTAVSAIEGSRLAPSVTAALALAKSLSATVEQLFGTVPAASKWAWPPPATSSRYWLAEVGGKPLRFPAESGGLGVVPHDGIFPADVKDIHPSASTLVMACCDPAVGILAAEYARQTGCRLLAFSRSSREALDLLGRGVIHVAGIHFVESKSGIGPAITPGRVSAAARRPLGRGLGDCTICPHKVGRRRPALEFALGGP